MTYCTIEAECIPTEYVSSVNISSVPYCVSVIVKWALPLGKYLENIWFVFSRKLCLPVVDAMLGSHNN